MFSTQQVIQSSHILLEPCSTFTLSMQNSKQIAHIHFRRSAISRVRDLFQFSEKNRLVDDIAATATHVLYPRRATTTAAADRKPPASIPTDIVETDTEYVFYLDVPGNGKRKRENGEEDGYKYLRLERKGKENLQSRFRLPEDAEVGAISTKCENGVLKITVGKKSPVCLVRL